MAEPKGKDVYGKFGKILPILLTPDKDIVINIKEACSDNGIRAGTVLTAVGSLHKATVLHHASGKVKTSTLSPPKVIPGPLQILSLVGVICEKDGGELHVHLHASVVDENGKVYGGHLLEGESPVLRRTEVVIGEIADVRMTEKYDEVTGEVEFSTKRL
jgi:predicted DNA-binding protein with PD1-like motif